MVEDVCRVPTPFGRFLKDPLSGNLWSDTVEKSLSPSEIEIGDLSSSTSLKTNSPSLSSVRSLETTSGKASWYSLPGRLTANGEMFNPNGLTAAHKTYPFGTIVRVRNTATKKFVDVRINDRGPFVKGRNIDLTPTARNQIGMGGLGNVTMEVISWGKGGHRAHKKHGKSHAKHHTSHKIK